MEKVAYKLVSSDDPHSMHVKINVENIEDFIGNPIYSSKKIYPNQLPAGVVTGLAYNAIGGSILYIEATQASYSSGQSRGSLRVTGSLGEVMKESSSIA